MHFILFSTQHYSITISSLYYQISSYLINISWYWARYYINITTRFNTLLVSLQKVTHLFKCFCSVGLMSFQESFTLLQQSSQKYLVTSRLPFKVPHLFTARYKTQESREASLPLGASAAAALVLMLVGLTLEPGGDLLLGLNQNVQQVFGYVAVFVVKERRGLTCTTQETVVSETFVSHGDDILRVSVGRLNHLTMKFDETFASLPITILRR